MRLVEDKSLYIIYVSTGTFFFLHCDEWDRVVALPRQKFVTGATLLQLGPLYVELVLQNYIQWFILHQTHIYVHNLVQIYRSFSITGNYGKRSFSKYGKHSNRNYSAILATLLFAG
jgi:hypothetical protein